MKFTRREALAGAAAGVAAAAVGRQTLAQGTEDAAAQQAGGSRPGDRVLICNEDSCTLTAIDPTANRVTGTVNLTSFDEDPRPPFRFANGGVVPTHAAMVATRP